MKLKIIIAGISAISSTAFAMQSPTLSPRTPELERASVEQRRLLEQTPPLFIAIENLAKANDVSAPYPAPSAAIARELSTIGRDKYALYHDAAEKYVSYNEYRTFPQGKKLQQESAAARAKLPQGSELGKLIDAGNVKEVMVYLVKLEQEDAQRNFDDQLKKDERRIVNLRGPNGETVFHLLARVGSVKIFNDIHAKKNLSTLISQIDSRGNTILHLVALFGNIDLMRELYSLFRPQLAAMLEATNAEGLTPRRVAIENNRTEIADVLTKLPTKEIAK